MISVYRPQLWFLFLLLQVTFTAQCDEGIPALLQFAENYQNTLPVEKKGTSTTVSKLITERSALRLVLKHREIQLAKQSVTLREQEQKLIELRQSLKVAELKLHKHQLKPTDLSPLVQFVSQLRDAASGSPGAKRSAALILQAREQAEKNWIELTDSKNQIRILAAQLTEQRNNNDSMQNKLTILQKILADRQQQTTTATDLIQSGDILKALHEKAKLLVKTNILNIPSGRQAYAAGSALGNDISEMLSERKSWGIAIDREAVLAGVIDSFMGQYQLPTDLLKKSLAESEDVVNKARQKLISGQKKKDDIFITEFKKTKGAKMSPSGFWYRVDYVGDTPIDDDAVVDVVVKESLTDGTVVQDMDLGGNVLSQNLSNYPPLFKEAISYIRDHGSLTMVVPPELAYGENGYPPKVPPNATMVYEIRIVNVKVN